MLKNIRTNLSRSNSKKEKNKHKQKPSPKLKQSKSKVATPIFAIANISFGRKKKKNARPSKSKSVGHESDTDDDTLFKFNLDRTRSALTDGLSAGGTSTDISDHEMQRELNQQPSVSSISSAFALDDDDDTTDEKEKDTKHDSNTALNKFAKLWNTCYLTEAIWTRACKLNALDDCECVQRVLYVTKYYHASQNVRNKYPTSELKEAVANLKEYTCTMLMNDYNHIKECHFQTEHKLAESDDEDDETEEQKRIECANENAHIHDYFIQHCFGDILCRADICKCIQRNFRDRSHCAVDDEFRRNLYRNRDSFHLKESDNELNIVKKQLLDSIHCAILHPQIRTDPGREDESKHDEVHLMHPHDDHKLQGLQLPPMISISMFDQSRSLDDEQQQDIMQRHSNIASRQRTSLMSDISMFKQPTISHTNFKIDDLFTPRQTKKREFIKQKTLLNLPAEPVQHVVDEDEHKNEPHEVESSVNALQPLVIDMSGRRNTESVYIDGGRNREMSLPPLADDNIPIARDRDREFLRFHEDSELGGGDEEEEVRERHTYEYGIKMIYDKDSIEGPQNVFNHHGYKSLHDEIVLNKLVSISEQQWKNCMEKALVKMRTVRGQRLIGKRGKFVGKSMELDHVMSVLLYCNFDRLQNEFRSTFRRLRADETDEEVRKRHSNYYLWGTHLNDAVFCFGDDILTQRLCVYHGLQQKLLFSEFEACFYSPLSTTVSIHVAQTFGGSNPEGMILKLIKSQDYSGYYLNVSWLSDFCDEEERLFHCSHKGFYLHIYSIIHNGIDYRKYVAALNLWDQIITPDFFISYDQKPKKNHQKILVRMLKHRLKMNEQAKQVEAEQENQNENEKEEETEIEDEAEVDEKEKAKKKRNFEFIDELTEYFCSSKISVGISLESDDLEVFIDKLASYIVSLTISCDIFKLFPNMQQLLIEYIEFSDDQLVLFMRNFSEFIAGDAANQRKMESIMFAEIFVDEETVDSQLKLNEMMKMQWPILLASHGWIVATSDKYPGRMELKKIKTRSKRQNQ